MKTIRWGIVGPGKIARKFARTIEKLPQCEIIAVCGINMEEADLFAEEFHVPHRFCDHQQMAAIEEIDVVYISTPHPFHSACAKPYLQAKKNVLCEKPMCMNAKQAEEMLSLAKENGVFLMEAMWMRFLPAIQEALERAQSGEIGAITGIRADTCAWHDENKYIPRLYENKLGGGSMLDMGIYAMHIIALFMGIDTVEISAMGRVAKEIDYHTTAIMRYADGRFASVSSSIDMSMPREVVIYGEKGHIRIPYFYRANEYYIGMGREPEVRYEKNCMGEGFEEEVLEVCQCIEVGKLQSDLHPLSTTIGVLKQIDEIRRQIGLHYAADDE